VANDLDSKDNQAKNPVLLTPKPPQKLTPEQDARLKERAQQLVTSVLDDLDNVEVVQQIEALGVAEMREAATKTDLLKTRLKDVMKGIESGKGDFVGGTLLDLRMYMDKINPHTHLKEIENISGAKRLFLRALGKLPAVGDIIKKIAHEFESVNEQIEAIMESLDNHVDTLLEDNISLGELYKGVVQVQGKVRLQAYAGELIANLIDTRLQEEQDVLAQQKLQALLHKVTTRVQDLKTMEQANLQFLISMDLTIDNNKSLSDSIRRTKSVTHTLLIVGLSIQAALIRQKQALQAVKATQDYAAEMLTQNADMVRQQGVEIAQLQNDPVLALDKVKEAFDTLTGALDEIEEIRLGGTNQMRENIAKLDGMSAELEPKVAALHAASQTEYDIAADITLEASS